MNPVDRIQLELFLSELENARVLVKNPHAETMIRRSLARQPDAAYLLAQRVLQLESALASLRAAAVLDAAPQEAPAMEPSAAHAAKAPWWRQPVDALHGTAVLLQSVAYLTEARAAA